MKIDGTKKSGDLVTEKASSKKTISTVVGRWRHRLVNGSLPEPAKRFGAPPHGIIANPERIRPQPYPVNESGDFYFKQGKYYSLVYQGKIGTYEQWSRARGIHIDNLRERIRSGLSMSEVMSKASLNITDHKNHPETAVKYCRCEFCLSKRVKDWASSIEPTDAPNPIDNGRFFKRNDGGLFIQTANGLKDLDSISRELGIKYKTLYARVFIYKWPLERAFGKQRNKEKA